MATIPMEVVKRAYTERRLFLSVVSRPMRLACTICTATYGNGAMTGTARTITQMRITATPLGLIPARLVFCVAAVGAAIPGSAGQPAVSGTRPTSGTTLSGFVSWLCLVAWTCRDYAFPFVLLPFVREARAGLKPAPTGGQARQCRMCNHGSILLAYVELLVERCVIMAYMCWRKGGFETRPYETRPYQIGGWVMRNCGMMFYWAMTGGV